MAVQTARALQQNFRREDLPEDRKREEWPQRLSSMITYLKRVKPDVIGAQECLNSQAADVQDGLGHNWTFVGRHHNVKVFWDSRVWEAEEGTLLETTLPSGLRHRYLITIRLKNKITGWGCWFSSIHLASGGPDEPNAPKLRLKQISQAIEILDAHIARFPHPEDGPTPNSVILGDINDNPQNGGVRKIALAKGYKPLQNRLPLSKIGGESLSSFHGYHTPTPRTGRWIDEILTRGVSLEDAALKRTDLDALPNYASDHNGLYADVLMTLPPAAAISIKAAAEA
jgi:endonuclease/exonuclease/phosphatase family metal-dependent hydrolase